MTPATVFAGAANGGRRPYPVLSWPEAAGQEQVFETLASSKPLKLSYVSAAAVSGPSVPGPFAGEQRLQRGHDHQQDDRSDEHAADHDRGEWPLHLAADAG